MVVVRPFKGLRPPQEIVAQLASRPYDVMNSVEARQEAAGNQYSLLHVTKAEIDLPEGTDEHSQAVYDKVVENFKAFQDKGWLVQDAEPKIYIYGQTMGERTQYGFVACTSIDDYFNESIKKHELTRRDKEDDRMIHVNITDANVEPVFFAYPAQAELDGIIEEVVKNQKPEYDFVADDGFGHHFRVINDQALIAKITELFAKVPALYVADGHHRTAAAARVGLERRAEKPDYTGEEEFNYFMAVIFPDNQLKIMDYNRVLKDLNGMSEAELLEKLQAHFTLEEKGGAEYRPTALHNFSMYLGNKRYSLTAKEGTYDDKDPIGVLDVTILSNLVLDQLFGIKDLRTDKRIDFVGGLRGLGELKRRVDNGEMKVAFALYPVSMQQLIDIADTGNIMPPKTTWFEPKLRSGLVIHKLS